MPNYWPSGNNAAEGFTSDAELVQAARRGDKRAFVEIVARHQAMVCGIALGILGDFAASEDAGQEAFLTSWRKIHELREPERLRPWLAQIARNAALGHLRRRRGHDSLDIARIVPDNAPMPDEAAANAEEAALVRESLSKLPENYRLPLILFYREGQSVAAVASSLGISEDAVRQRLARGREMLRDRVSTVIESVLTRSGPTAIFTMTIAAAIGALAAPATVAGGVFAAATAAAGSSTAGAAAAPALTTMSTSKTVIAVAAVVTVVCIPVGYNLGTFQPSAVPRVTSPGKAHQPAPAPKAPSFESSALFAEWRQLHDTHGRTAEAMPALYKAIADLKDPFRRRAFRAALIAEWVQVDAPGGFTFFLGKGPDDNQRRQFFEEWLAHDPAAAMNALLQRPAGWEKMARESLSEIARRMPSHLAEVVSRLPKSNRFYDSQVRDAFTLLAENGLVSARSAAQSVTGPNREQALGGIATVWSRSDLEGAIAWARELPEGTDRHEIIRAALLGKAAVDPIAALESVDLVPPGGRHAHGNSTTGARVLREAAKADFDATIAWIAAHPGQLGTEDLGDGLSSIVTERLNADPKAFLTKHAADGTLAIVLPALGSAILNSAGGQRGAVWEWLKTQPETDINKLLKDRVLSSAGYQAPELAMKFAADLPQTSTGAKQLESLASSLLNGGSMLHRFDTLMAQAPERLKQPLVEAAFRYLQNDYFNDPQRWVSRLHLLPESSRARGVAAIAGAWAQTTPEEAIAWAATMDSGDSRSDALAAIASSWARKDAHTAAEWIASMSPGLERDRSAASLVLAVADQAPQEAWEWALSIADPAERNRAAGHAARTMAARHPATARQWLETAALPPEAKAEIEATLRK